MIHEFSFGMGPSVLSKKRGETLWSLRALPIGGYVRLQGEEGDPDKEEQQKIEGYDPSRSLSRKKPWERLVVIAAGAAVNLILAWLLTAALLAGYGVLDLERPAVGVVMDGTPAQSAGIMPGDIIRSINGVDLNKWSDIKLNIQNDKITDDNFSITVQRKERQINFKVNIPYSEKRGGRLLGVQPERQLYPIGKAFAQGLSYSWNMGIEMLQGIWMVLTGKLHSDVVGPVGIAVMAGDAFKQGFWSFIAFLGVINLNLGLLNLFPFPALDGGRIIFILFELVTGKKVPQKWESWIHYAGFVILITLIIYITGNDIARLFKK